MTEPITEDIKLLLKYFALTIEKDGIFQSNTIQEGNYVLEYDSYFQTINIKPINSLIPDKNKFEVILDESNKHYNIVYFVGINQKCVYHEKISKPL